jgi:iron complex outermembrane receptor protein
VQADFKYKRLNLTGGYRCEGQDIKGLRYNWNPFPKISKDDLSSLNQILNQAVDIAKGILLPTQYIKMLSGFYNENSKQEQLLRFGINFKAAEGTYLRASYGQGFRFPTIAEKYIRTQVGSIVIYPNDSLNLERGNSFEVGVRQIIKLGENWIGFFDESYFVQKYTNMMEFTFGAWGNPFVDPIYGLGFKSKNIGNTRIAGAEISVGGDGKIGKFRQTFMGGVTYIEPTQTDFNLAKDSIINSSSENILKYRNKTIFKFDSETTYKSFAFGVSTRYYSFMENIDKIFEVVIPGVKDYRDKNPDGEWVFDARLAYKVNESVQLSFVTKNVLNNLYVGRPADLQAPRSFNIQAMVKF